MLSLKINAKPVFAGNQDAAFVQLFSGKALAAGSNSQLKDGYALRENKKFRVLWSSEPFQDLALMASGKVPEKDVNAVAQAFLNMHKDPVGKDILQRASKEVGLSNDAYFIPATGADYASYRRFFQTAPLSLQ